MTQHTLSAVICVVIALFTRGQLTNAVIADSPSDAKAVAQMALDALLTREAQWKTGTMVARVAQRGGDEMSAELSCVWNEGNTFVDVRQLTETSLSIEGQLRQVARDPFLFFYTHKEHWVYLPAVGGAIGHSMDKPREVPRNIEVRPLRLWSTFPGVPSIRLTNSLRKAIADNENLEFTALENGQLRLKRKSMVYFIDAASGGDIVRLEHGMDPAQWDPDSLADPMMVTATYEWARDPHGVPYCRLFRAQHFEREQPESPVATREVEVLSYDSQVPNEKARFDLSAFDLPVGTKMSFVQRGRSRSWRHGVPESESEDVLQIDLEKLIEESKQAGFARPVED